MILQRLKNFIKAFQPVGQQIYDESCEHYPSKTWEEAWKLEPTYLRTPYKLGFNGRHINGTTQQQRELKALFPAERWQEAYNAGRKARETHRQS